MSFTLRISILVFLAPLLCADPSQEAVAAESASDAQATQEQLEINVFRDSLFNGSTEKSRTEAAMVMLYNSNDLARKVLLDALSQKENAGASMAVCRALSLSRLGNKSVADKDVFIEPLLNILKETDQAQAKLVSEASLVFDYQVIGPHLEGLAQDTAASVSARLNAIDALELRLDSAAATTIVGLAADDNERIKRAATDALQYMQARGVYVEELQDKSRDEFLRDWLIAQEERMRQERAQKALWIDLYFKAIEQLYANIADKDAQQRAAFLIARLQAPQTERTLWALQKVYEWRLKGEAIPEGLTPVLVGLVSSNNRSVRLEAARQLSYMGRLESAPDLLTQLGKEKDDEVRTELFTALGAACKSALLNGGIPGETKAKILDWAARFLNEQDTAKAIKGADVIGKLLEKNSLPAADTGKYLDLLTTRYDRSEANALRGELLRTMTSLCTDRSGCRNEARQRFKAIFEKAILDETDRVREEAVPGLINIDEMLALNGLRGSFSKEKNPRIRSRIIELTSVVGDERDLEWLLANVGSEAETEASWQAILKILAQSEPELLEQWMRRLGEARQQGRVSDGLWQAFLKDAERKAEKKPVVLNEVLRLRVDYHRDKGELAQARAYLVRLLQGAEAEKKTALEVELFAMDLALGDVKTAAAALLKVLSQGDLDEKDGFVKAIDQLLAGDSADKTGRGTVESLLKALGGVQARPNWDKLKAGWLAAHVKPEAGGSTIKQD